VQKAIMDEKITAGHARVIAGLDDPKEQAEFFKKIVRLGLNVRETENIVKKATVKSHERVIGGDPTLAAKEAELASALGTKVKIKKSGLGGEIDISFYSPEELAEIIRKIVG